MRILTLDHLVLTVASIDRTLAFYRDVLGMRAESFEGERWALHFGTQKFNLHEAGHEFEPKAAHPAPGTVDLCLIAATPLEEVMATLAEHGVPLIEGPVTRTGARGEIRSVYVRDPDDNLVEIANYPEREAS
ncbi:VOC family protein [Winogradskya consettensis]|uniref:Ring-cleaving dioxygenase n=1 Tax=Winogradskya consettensis TaxID=113560 RepID=A0A919SAU7_9ACTN|nr:VOC family protein [Actinoplanes consettensis]GIM69154.1 ring-cleaving dioxygenase [Actinoplanes consettensis]